MARRVLHFVPWSRCYWWIRIRCANSPTAWV